MRRVCWPRLCGNRGMLTIFVNHGWRLTFRNCRRTSITRCCKAPKDENKGIVGTWEVDVIDAPRR